MERIDYRDRAVNLEEICSELSLDLESTEQEVQDEDGNPILGTVNFSRKSIRINSHRTITHNKENRKRFTIAHEIGHFCLQHDNYLRSESVLERDLLIDNVMENSFNYERLEFQANAFASHLLLPEYMFRKKTAEIREHLGIKDRGHGYIFVDNQPWNDQSYNELRSILSTYFEVSKQAIEIKFKKLGMLNDQRKGPEGLTIRPTTAD